MPQLLLGSGADALDLLADPYMATVGSSWGEWVAITTTTDSLFLDGSIVSGEQSGNRTIAVQVLVRADPRPSLVRACELLFAQANKQANTLTFVPDDGVPVVYDVFRAQPERTDDQSEAWGYRTYTFTFPALPFTRSDQRVTPGALAPALVVDDFNTTTAGFLLSEMPPIGQSIGGYSTTWAIPIADAAVSPVVSQVASGALTAVSGCTVANGTVFGTSIKMTATQAGTMEARSTASWATSAAVITAAVKAAYSGHTMKSRVGVEWLDSTGATISTDWGLDRSITSTAGSVATGAWPDVWSASPRPAAATQFRVRVQADAVAAGDYLEVAFIVGWPSVTVPPAPTAGVGVGGSGAFRSLPDGRSATTPPTAFANFIRRVLAVPLDVSGVALPQLAAQVQSNVGATTLTSGGPTAVSVRLYDSTGRWSRFDLTGTTVVSQWATASASIAAPARISPAGACNLADIVAHDVAVIGAGGNGSYCDLDQLVVSPTFTGVTSPRGTVFDLDDIIGSARTTTKVALSTTVASTDFLVAVAEPDVLPMLAVASSVATASAPAAYGAAGDGVYRIIGCLAPASAENNPTCVVNQRINGVSVATQTLTGTMQPGNHYCDFGTVALPLVGTPAENQAVSYTFTLAPADTDWAEVLVLDVDQPLAWLTNLSTAQPFVWIDEPDPTAQLGRVWVGTAADRSDARSPTTPPDLSRPFQVRSPGVRLLAYSTSGAPNVSLSYYPRWLVEPTQ